MTILKSKACQKADRICRGILEFLIVQSIFSVLVLLLLPSDPDETITKIIAAAMTLPCSFWIAWRSAQQRETFRSRSA